MKNSSRLFAEIDRKRRRSSSGWFGLEASSRTRRLNWSQDSSRFTKRSGEWRSERPASTTGSRAAPTACSTGTVGTAGHSSVVSTGVGAASLAAAAASVGTLLGAAIFVAGSGAVVLPMLVPLMAAFRAEAVLAVAALAGVVFGGTPGAVADGAAVDGAAALWTAVFLAGARLTAGRRGAGLVASGRRGSAASSAASRSMGFCVDSIPIPVLAGAGAFSILHP
jgi:hypothetical protein